MGPLRSLRLPKSSFAGTEETWPLSSAIQTSCKELPLGESKPKKCLAKDFGKHDSQASSGHTVESGGVCRLGQCCQQRGGASQHT